VDDVADRQPDESPLAGVDVSYYNDQILAVVDQRIAALTQRTTAVGTVASHPGTYYGRECSVTFDGSSVAVPCRLPSSVRALVGDRVGLQKFGSDWVVVFSFTPHEFQAVGHHSLGPGDFSTNSSTPSTVGGYTPIQFTKLYTDTAIEAFVMIGWHSDTTFMSGLARLAFQRGGIEHYGINMVVQDFAGTTPGGGLTFNPETSSGVHPSVHRGMNAGTYDVDFQWSVWTGSGTIYQHDRSMQSFSIREIP
jgi:hypothetical protein